MPDIGSIVGGLVQIVTFLWLVVQIGDFIKLHIRWGRDTLFWLFWVCFVSLIMLTAHTLDLYVQIMMMS